jgi:hypothetical protein
VGTEEIQVEDRGDDEEFADHFVALRLQGRWGTCKWVAAHALTLLVALAGFVAFVSLSLVIADLFFSVGITGEYSEEDVAVTRESAPTALRLLLIALAVGIPAFAAAAGVLASAGRRLGRGFRLPPPVPRPIPARPRLTRREAAARARRSGWGGGAAILLASLVPGCILIALEWPDLVPWAAGISLLARLGRAVLVVLLGLAALATLLAVACLLYLVLMIAGWIRSGMAGWLLPERARLRLPPGEATAPRLPPPSPAEPGAPASPSLLAYLFADRMVEADSPGRLGAPVPCAETEVAAAGLAATLLAVAFWDLRERGAVRLEPGRRRLPLLRRRIEVTRLREEMRPGLAGKAMRVPNADPEAFEGEDTSGKAGPLGDVPSVVGGILDPSDDPEWAIVAVVLEEGRELGLFAAGGDGQGQPLRANCGAIAREEEAFRTFAAGWRRFEQDDRELARALRRECATSIRRLRTYPEAGGPFSLALQMAMRTSERADRPWPRSA